MKNSFQIFLIIPLLFSFFFFSCGEEEINAYDTQLTKGLTYKLIRSQGGVITEENVIDLVSLGFNEKENTLLIKSLSAEAKTELMDKHLKKILIRLSQKST